MESSKRCGRVDHAGKKLKPPDEGLLDEKELALFLKMSLGSVRRWRREGMGPRYRKFGKSVRYTSSDVTEWVASRPSGGTSGIEETNGA